MQKHRKIKNVPFPRPCGATGNDARKLHALAFVHVRGALLMHEVLCLDQIPLNVRPNRTGGQNFCLDPFIFRGGAEPAKLLIQLFRVIKQMDQIEPHLPHPLGGGGGPAPDRSP